MSKMLRILKNIYKTFFHSMEKTLKSISEKLTILKKKKISSPPSISRLLKSYRSTRKTFETSTVKTFFGRVKSACKYWICKRV